MPRSIEEAHAEQRRTVAEWVTTIITVFWSVWWGFFMHRVLVEGADAFFVTIPYMRPSLSLEVPKGHYLVVNALLTSYFAFAYAHWLWNAQRTSYQRFLVKSLLQDSAALVVSLFFLLASIGFAGTAFLVPDALLFYGVLLTVMWPAVVLAAVWKI